MASISETILAVICCFSLAGVFVFEFSALNFSFNDTTFAIFSLFSVVNLVSTSRVFFPVTNSADVSKVVFAVSLVLSISEHAVRYAATSGSALICSVMLFAGTAGTAGTIIPLSSVYCSFPSMAGIGLIVGIACNAVACSTTCALFIPFNCSTVRCFIKNCFFLLLLILSV